MLRAAVLVPFQGTFVRRCVSIFAMCLLSSLIMLFSLSLLAQTGISQSGANAKLSETEDDRSFYLDQPIFHPEALSGIWETPNGNGGAVGIHLQLATKLPDDSRVSWTPQAWQHLVVGVFERKATDEAFGNMNGFTDSKRGGGVSYKDGRLVLHFVWLAQDPLIIDLDLRLRANGCWHGRFHRNSFDRVVSLCRPTPGRPFRLNPLVGTWSQTNRFLEDCLHIVQTGPDTFTGWTDSLQIPGKARYAPTIPGPHQLYENYGSPLKVERFSSGIVRITFGAYGGICCPHAFLGKLNADDSILKGNFDSATATFARTAGDSCVR
jgi:hypothetical protein